MVFVNKSSLVLPSLTFAILKKWILHYLINNEPRVMVSGQLLAYVDKAQKISSFKVIISS